MKNILILMLYLIFQTHGTAQQVFLEAFKEKWEHNKNYVIECASLMPESSYDFKPTKEVSSFKKQLIHMIGNMSWITKDYLNGPSLEHDIKNADPTKDEVILILEKAFDNAAVVIDKMTDPELSRKVDFFAGEKNVLQMMEPIQP